MIHAVSYMYAKAKLDDRSVKAVSMEDFLLYHYVSVSLYWIIGVLKKGSRNRQASSGGIQAGNKKQLVAGRDNKIVGSREDRRYDEHCRISGLVRWAWKDQRILRRGTRRLRIFHFSKIRNISLAVHPTFNRYQTLKSTFIMSSRT